MAFSIQQFRQIFDEFSSTTTYPDAKITYWYSLSTGNTDTTIYDANTYDKIIDLKIAHYLKVSNDAKSNYSPSGTFVSSREGESVKVNYNELSNNGANINDFSSTEYGRILKTLLISPIKFIPNDSYKY